MRKAEKRRGYNGVIIDGRAYIAVRDDHYFRLYERCDLSQDGLAEDGSLGASVSNAFLEHFPCPVRFRHWPELTEAIAELSNKKG